VANRNVENQKRENGQEHFALNEMKIIKSYESLQAGRLSANVLISLLIFFQTNLKLDHY